MRASYEAYNRVQGMGGCLYKGGSLFSQNLCKRDAEIMILSITHDKKGFSLILFFSRSFDVVLVSLMYGAMC